MADKDFVVKNGLVVNTNLIVANGDSNRVGINNSSPDAALTVTGTANISGNVVLNGGTLNVASNSTFTGNVNIKNTATIDTRLYVGNTATMVPGLPSIIQAVDNFNGFVMISSQNLSQLDDACADLIIYADNTNGLSNFNDLGINNSRFDGTIHRISTNTVADSFVLGETVFQSNGTANIAVGIVKDVTVINTTSRSVKISVLETDGIKTSLGAPNFSNTTDANLSLRGVTSGVNASILVAVPFGTTSAYSRRNYPFTIGKRGDGYLYNANSALTIGTTGGGIRTNTQTIATSFSSGANQLILTSGNTANIYADLIITGTGIPSDTYVTSVVNSTAFNISKLTTSGSSDSYTLTDLFYDAAGNPIIFHVEGMTANDEVARFSGNGNFTIGLSNVARNSKLTVGGTANITGNTAFGNNVTVAGNVAVSGTTNAIAFRAGANVSVNTTTIFMGNSTVNAVQNSSTLQFANSTITSNLTAGDLKIGAITSVNSTQITATLVNANLVGSYANISGQVNTGTLFAATSANIASATLANSTGIYTTGVVNSISYTTGAGFGAASAGMTVNNTTVGLSSNATVNASMTTALIRIANNLSSANLSPADLRIGTTVVNSTHVSVNQVTGTNASLNFLSVAGNASLNNFVLTSNASHNVVSINSSNVNIDSGLLFVDFVNNRVGLNVIEPNATLQVNGTANVSGNLFIGGDFTVAGIITYQGTSVSNGDFTPNINGLNLGNTTNRWNLFGTSAALTGRLNSPEANLSSILKVGANASINTTAFSFTGLSDSIVINSSVITVGSNVVANTSALFVGNSTINAIAIQDTVQVSNSTAVSNLTAGALRVGANVTINTTHVAVGANVLSNSTTMFVGNSTVNTIVNQTTLQVSNSSVTSNLTAGSLRVGTATTVNTSVITLGSNVYANLTNLFVGNTTEYITQNSTLLSVVNSSITSNLSPLALRVGSNASLNTSALFIGNSTVNTFTTVDVIQIANSTITSNLTAAALRVGANVSVNTSATFIGNSTVNTFTTQDTIQIANATATSNLTPSALRLGSNVVANTTTVFIGNSTLNTVVTQTLLQIANTLATSNLTPTALRVGANVVVNTTHVAVGANVIANSTTVFVGNSTVNTFTTQDNIQIANATATSNLTPTALRVGANATVNTTQVTIGNSSLATTLLTLGGQVSANGGVGTSGQVLTSAAGSNTYWATPINSVSGGAGLTGSGTSGPVTLDVGAANGITVFTDAVGVTQGTGIVVNTSGVHVNANYINTISSNSATFANQSVTNAFTVGTGSYFVSNGNVGIANSTPVHKLRVEGDISLTGAIHANGSVGSDTQMLTSNGTTTYWKTPITNVIMGNGVVGGGSSGPVTITVGQGFGIVTNATATAVNPGTGIVANATGVHVNATYIGTLTANDTLNLGGVAAASYQLNSTLAANVATLTANNSTNLGGVPASNYVNASGNFTLGGNITFTSANTTATAGFKVGSNVVINTSAVAVLGTGTNVVINTTAISWSGNVVGNNATGNKYVSTGTPTTQGQNGDVWYRI